MILLGFLSCINDYSSTTSKDRSMGLREQEADTRGSRVAGQVGFKSHVQTLITVRCIINSYNLPHGPAKPTYPLQTAYYQLLSLSPSVDPNGQLPWFTVCFVCAHLLSRALGPHPAPTEAHITWKNAHRVILSLDSFSGNILENQSHLSADVQQSSWISWLNILNVWIKHTQLCFLWAISWETA